MKKNIKIKKIITFYLSLILAANFSCCTFAKKTKIESKPVIKTNKKNPTKNKSNSNLEALLKNIKKNSTNNKKKPELDINSFLNNSSDISPDKSTIVNKNIKNPQYKIQLRISESNKLMRSFILLKIWKYLNNFFESNNIEVEKNEEKTCFFNILKDDKQVEIHVNLPGKNIKDYNESKKKLENFLKNNLPRKCKDFIEDNYFSIENNYFSNDGIKNIANKIDDYISSEISSTKSYKNKLEKAKNNSKESLKIGKKFFENEEFKNFVDFLNPELYNLLKTLTNNEIFSALGKEVIKKELTEYSSNFHKLENLKKLFSKFFPKSLKGSIFSLNYDDDDNDNDDDYDYDYYDKYDYDYDDDDDNYHNYFNFRRYRKSIFKRDLFKKKKIKTENLEFIRKIKSALNNVRFKNIQNENSEILDKNKKLFEDYFKKLKIILEKAKFNFKKENNNKISPLEKAKEIFGTIKNDLKLTRKIVKEKNNSKIKDEITEILEKCFGMSPIFKEKEKENNQELIKIGKNLLPIKIKYLKNLKEIKPFKKLENKTKKTSKSKDTKNSEKNNSKKKTKK